MHSQSRNLEFENEKIKNFLVLKKSALIKHKESKFVSKHNCCVRLKIIMGFDVKKRENLIL